MQFLYPSFLWGLLAISIPILIHLFHFRRFKNVYFSNIRFLKELKEETSNRNKLKNLLVLISRIIVISALVLAFAQPFIPQSEEMMKGNRAVSVFVDNSFSMQAQGEDIDLLNKAKLDAIHVINAYDNSDRFQIITHDFSFSQQKWLNKEQAVEAVENIDVTHDVQLLSQIVQKQHQALEESKSENHLVYWLSDFQKSMVDLYAEQLDSSVNYQALYLSSVKTENLSIDSCWWVAPIPVKGQRGSLIVQIRNYGNQDIEDLTVNLEYNEQNYPLAKVQVPSDQSVTDTLRFTLNKGGWSEAKVSIKDFPVRFDDEYLISFEVSENIPVLVISESGVNPYIESVFSSSPIFELDYNPISAIEYSSLGNYKLILMDGVNGFSSGLIASFKEYAQDGGNLMIFPGSNVQLDDYNQLLAALGANLLTAKEEGEMGVGRIVEEEFVFKEVFEKIDRNISLPEVSMRYLTSSGSQSTNRQVLVFRDGRSYLDAYQIGQGNLYFSTAPLDPAYNDLVKMAEIFVPMIYRMALSSNIGDKIAYTVGRDRLLKVKRKLSASEVPYKIIGEKEFIPGFRNIGPLVQLDVQDQIDRSGIYTLIHEQDTLKRLAFNYDRRESDLTCLTRDELEERIAPRGEIFYASENEIDLTEAIIAREKGVLLWKWFIILALLFLAIEIFLLRAIKI
jgi:hypothetical protein